jgi:hypothetical protein
MIKVVETSALDEDDYRSHLEITMQEDDNKKECIASFTDGEPEDNTLARDFSDCYSIHKLLQKFYVMGQQGIEVEFSERSVEWGDWND